MFTLRFKLLCASILLAILAGLAFNQVLLNKRISRSESQNRDALRLSKDALDISKQVLSLNVTPTASPSASPTPVLAITLAPKVSSRSAVPTRVIKR